MIEINKSYRELLKYLLLAVSGLLIILISTVFQVVVIPKQQDDFSHFLNYNFTRAVAIVFFIVGILIGYFWKLNAWKAGMSLFLVFPVTALIKSFIYKGSHNLIPFELLMYFFYALPSIIAVYIAKYIYQRTTKVKRNGNDALTYSTTWVASNLGSSKTILS